MNVNRMRATGVARLVVPMGLAALLAGCGSMGYGSGSGGSTTPPAGSGSGAVTISTQHGSAGTYLTGSGRALYLWEADTGGKSTCSGACATVWPPVLTTGTPHGSGGVNAGKLGTVKRSDGKMQVTYAGHPLYFYTSDTSAGQTTGQGSKGFGARWWLVSPSGTAIQSGGGSSGYGQGY